MASIAGLFMWSHSIPKPSETSLAFADAATITSLLPHPHPSPSPFTVLSWGLGRPMESGERNTEFMLKSTIAFCNSSFSLRRSGDTFRATATLKVSSTACSWAFLLCGRARVCPQLNRRLRFLCKCYKPGLFLCSGASFQWGILKVNSSSILGVVVDVFWSDHSQIRHRRVLFLKSFWHQNPVNWKNCCIICPRNLICFVPSYLCYTATHRSVQLFI